MEIHTARLRHQQYDRISIPEDVPALDIETGDEGTSRDQLISR